MKAAIRVAVVAHAGKTFGGGLKELRKVLARAGHGRPLWCEVPNTRKAPKAARGLVKKGASLVFVWGGDGMVQRCIDALAGRKVTVAILPAGTANLLAANLGIPQDISKAVRIGLRGTTQALDVGVMNGERFAVMAGTGLDALTMKQVGGKQKERLGRLAYVGSGLKAMRAKRVRMKVRVDGTTWFEGKASNVLFGNVGKIFGGLEVFPDASSTDGMIELGVVTAKTTLQWLRVFSRVAVGHVERSPFVRTTRGKKIVVELDRKTPFELDGGARPSTRRLKVRVEPAAISVCVPWPAAVKRPRPEKAPPARSPRRDQASMKQSEIPEVDAAAAAGNRPSAPVNGAAA